MSKAEDILFKLEVQSSPFLKGGFVKSNKAQIIIGGHILGASSSINRGHSGKGYTTHYYLDGKRTAREEIKRVIDTIELEK